MNPFSWPPWITSHCQWPCFQVAECVPSLTCIKLENCHLHKNRITVVDSPPVVAVLWLTFSPSTSSTSFSKVLSVGWTVDCRFDYQSFKKAHPRTYITHTVTLGSLTMKLPGPYITIPQYRFNKTKKHTRLGKGDCLSPIWKWSIRPKKHRKGGKV